MSWQHRGWPFLSSGIVLICEPFGNEMEWDFYSPNSRAFEATMHNDEVPNEAHEGIISVINFKAELEFRKRPRPMYGSARVGLLGF